MNDQRTPNLGALDEYQVSQLVSELIVEQNGRNLPCRHRRSRAIFNLKLRKTERSEDEREEVRYRGSRRRLSGVVLGEFDPTPELVFRLVSLDLSLRAFPIVIQVCLLFWALIRSLHTLGVGDGLVEATPSRQGVTMQG